MARLAALGTRIVCWCNVGRDSTSSRNRTHQQSKKSSHDISLKNSRHSLREDTMQAFQAPQHVSTVPQFSFRFHANFYFPVPIKRHNTCCSIYSVKVLQPSLTNAKGCLQRCLKNECQPSVPGHISSPGSSPQHTDKSCTFKIFSRLEWITQHHYS